MAKTHGLIALVAFLGIAVGSAVWAGESSFGWGKQEIALSLGYGITVPMPPFGGTVKNLGFFQATPRWGIGISDPLGGDSWYRGNFELLVEAMYLREFRPEQGNAGGGSLGVRYNFLSSEKFVPFFETGATLLSLNFNAKRHLSGLYESGYGGIGAHYFLTDQVAVTGHWRFQHISNGDHRKKLGVNNTINSGVALFGVSYFLN